MNPAFRRRYFEGDGAGEGDGCGDGDGDPEGDGEADGDALGLGDGDACCTGAGGCGLAISGGAITVVASEVISHMTRPTAAIAAGTARSELP